MSSTIHISVLYNSNIPHQFTHIPFYLFSFCFWARVRSCPAVYVSNFSSFSFYQVVGVWPDHFSSRAHCPSHTLLYQDVATNCVVIWGKKCLEKVRQSNPTYELCWRKTTRRLGRPLSLVSCWQRSQMIVMYTQEQFRWMATCEREKVVATPVQMEMTKLYTQCNLCS